MHIHKQRASMQQQHSWTYAAYNIEAIANFTAAVAAEVRRQEDVYDETAETLRVQKEVTDFQFLEAKKKRFPPDSQLYCEDVNNYLADSEKILSDDLSRLKEAYPLGYEGVDPEGALGTYRLRSSLLRHVQRIEAERRDTAVAAGDGTSSSSSSFPVAMVPLLLPLTSSRVKAEEGREGESSPQRSGETLSSSTFVAAVADGVAVRVKQEAADETREDAAPSSDHELSSRKRGRLTPSSSCSETTAGVVASPPRRQQQPLLHVKEEANGSPSSAFPPSWTFLKPETATRTAVDRDNGAYLTPHPTACGAPFLRYASTPPLSAATSSLPPLPPPTFVIPACTLSTEAQLSQKKVSSIATSSQARAGSRRSASPERLAWSAPPSLHSNAMPSLSPSATLNQWSRDGSADRSGATTAVVTHLTRAHAEEGDRVMQLWRKLWPGQRPTTASHHPALLNHDEATPSTNARHGAVVVRPTVVMVKAVADVAQTTFERARARLSAQQARAAQLLTQLKESEESPHTRGTAVSAHDKEPPKKAGGVARSETSAAKHRRRQRQLTTEAHSEDKDTTSSGAMRSNSKVDDNVLSAAGALSNTADIPNVVKSTADADELVALQQQLARELMDLEAKHSEREKVVAELLGAIEQAPTPTQPQRSARINKTDGMERAYSPAEDFSTIGCQLSLQRRRAVRQRKGGALPGDTGLPSTPTTQRQQHQKQGVEVDATVSAPSDLEEVAARRRALLREALLHPRRLVAQLQASRSADAQWSTTRQQGCTHASSASATAIETIALPPLEEDRHAADLEAYMWPTELDARIRHELHGYTDLSGRLRRSYHISLSQEDVRQLEERCAAPATSSSEHGGDAVPVRDIRSVLPNNIDTHVIALPNCGTHGWLYVQGRGEAIVAQLKLI